MMMMMIVMMMMKLRSSLPVRGRNPAGRGQSHKKHSVQKIPSNGMQNPIFCELRRRPREIFFEKSFFFKAEPLFFLPDSYGDPQAEQSTLVIVENDNENLTFGRTA